MRLKLVAAAAAMMIGVPASAATLIVDSDGKLLGATGVIVDGSSYTVTFREGTCANVFSGCNEAADFPFQDSTTALLAAQALLDQVFVDGPQGNFDSLPNLTKGCDHYTGLCQVYLPFRIVDDRAQAAVAINKADTDSASTSGYVRPETDSTPLTTTYATFSPSVSAVPEPATWAMMLFGFGAVGCSMRSRKAGLKESKAV